MISDDTTNPVYENLASELRRGVMVLAVLAECRELQYGYSLKQRLSAAGLDIKEGTLYPLLRRMEEQGLLRSEWQVAEDSRPRRYYILNDQGTTVLHKLAGEWHALVAGMAEVLPEQEGEQK